MITAGTQQTATQAYRSIRATQQPAPDGLIPVPVTRICILTFYCQYQDIRPRNAGHELIADLVSTQALP